MVRGPGEALAETCQLVLFDPTLLSCAKKRGVEPPRRNCYFTLARKYTRVCGPLCDPRGSSQAMPSLSSASTVFVSTLVLDCNCKPVCSSFNDQAAEQQTLQSFAAAKAFLLCKNPCRGAAMGMGSPAQSRENARAKKFPEEICFAPSRSAKFVVPPTRERSKVRNHARLGKISCTGQPWVPEGPRSLCFGKESRGTPSKGFLWATFFAEARHRASFADKKRGVETTRLAGYCQLKLAPAATDGSKKPLAAALGSKNKKKGGFRRPKTYSYRGTMIFTAR